MAKNSENGHAKNVANFDELIEFAKGLKEKYNPSKELITLTGLQALQDRARQTMKNLKTAETAFLNATNRRAEAFEPLKQLSTSIVAAFSMVATKADVKDVQGLQRKIYGMRAGKKAKEPPSPLAAGEQPVPANKTISVAQLSYDSLLEHFDKLIEAVKANADYKPNEENLTVDGLKDHLAELRAIHSRVDATLTEWRNARITRWEVLYHEVAGLVTAAFDVKKYVKSVFKTTSTQYKQVRAIRFRRRKA